MTLSVSSSTRTRIDHADCPATDAAHAFHPRVQHRPALQNSPPVDGVRSTEFDAFRTSYLAPSTTYFVRPTSYLVLRAECSPCEAWILARYRVRRAQYLARKNPRKNFLIF